MSFTMKSLGAALVAATFFSSAQAHIYMTSPQPFPFGSVEPLSPLDASGANYPCKGVPYNAGSIDNHAAVGEEVPLSFHGSAVHGGGSCQISLTTDTAPTKSTKWFVIHSIEGGCPSKTITNGNGQEGTSATSNYTFKIPDGVAPGKYTLAWTWFNKIGNREMYMNCAPFTVSGGSSKRAIEARKEANRFQLRQSNNNFPSMYIANICNQQCTTKETTCVQFPDPGTNVDKFGNPSDLVTPTCSCNPASGGTAPVSGGSGSSSNASSASGSSPSGSPSGSSGAAPSSASPQPLAQGTASASGSAPSSGASSGNSSSAPASSAAAGSAPSSAPSAAAGSSSGSGSGAASGGSAGGPGSQSCSNPGSVVCSSDGKMFGICDTNSKAVMQAVAAGTACANGQITAAGASAGAANGSAPAAGSQ